MRRLGALALLALSCSACVAPEPRLEDRHQLANLELPQGAGRLYYRDLSPAQAQRLSPEVAGVYSLVAAQLGFAPPRAEMVVYAQERATLNAVRETRCELIRSRSGWEIVFAYPYRPEEEGALLGTTGHEMAEATVLLRVTALDPHLRWVHDGIGDLVEHEVLRQIRARDALASLQRVRAQIETQLGEGALWIDLTRWRQLAPWIVRSHRLLEPGEPNLSLEDIDGSLIRVRQARANCQEPTRAAGLSELEAMLVRTRQIRERGYAPGEARGRDQRDRDLLGYTLSFAYWLEVERRAPGTARRFLALLDARRAGGDHVLSWSEAQATLREALGAPPPPVARYPLERALSVVETEESRLRQELTGGRRE